MQPMHTRIRTTAMLALTMAMADASAQQRPTTDYAPVNGLRMYYAVHGRTATWGHALHRAWPSCPTPRM